MPGHVDHRSLPGYGDPGKFLASAEYILPFTPVQTSVDYAASANQLVLVDTTNNSVTVTLPSHVAGARVTIKWISGAYACSISSDNIDGYATHILGELYDSLQLESDGAMWHVV